MVQKFYEFVFNKPFPDDKIESVLSKFGDMKMASAKPTNRPLTGQVREVNHEKK